MEKYFGKLIEDYEQILDNEFADLKKKLLGNLEIILNGKTLQENLLDKPINCDSILKNVKNKGFLTRITNTLKILDFSENIKTYKDLQKECYEYLTTIKDKNERSWKDEKAYSYYLQHFRNVGYKSVYLIISHLKSINFDFGYESAKKSYEKSDK